MQLTLAGPGAGKTTDMIAQILEKIEELPVNRDMVIITYTNTSADDITRKLNKKIIVPHNVFIGTIHSFLLHYFIIPHAYILGYATSSISIVDKLDGTGMEWIDRLVDNNVEDKKKDYIKRAMVVSSTKKRIEAAAKKGVYTYDGIIKISKELSEKKEVVDCVTNKISFLFVDEYQDISKYAHEIIKNIEKRKKTTIAVVGDPDQSIYRFRYGESQIGEKAPKKEKQPIRELMNLESNKCSVRKLLVNYRSSYEIVRFNNRYGTLDDQIPDRGPICKIMFFQTNNVMEMYDWMREQGGLYKCNDYLVLAKNQKDADRLAGLRKETAESGSTRIKLKTIIDYMVANSGISYTEFVDRYHFSRYDLKRIAAHVRHEIEAGNICQGEKNKDINTKIQRIIKDLYQVKVQFCDSVLNEGEKREKYNYLCDLFSRENANSTDIRFMTIHKSKGIEADCVLVLASSESQLFKWLEMNGEDMKSETDEDYRLGYVAFTRARKVLILCCLKEIDIAKIDPEIFSIIHS